MLSRNEAGQGRVRRALVAAWRVAAKTFKVLFILALVVLPIPVPALLAPLLRRDRRTHSGQVLKKE